MLATPAPLQEKLTLFWHGHFTSAYQKGIPAQAMLDFLSAKGAQFLPRTHGRLRLTRASPRSRRP